MTTLIEDIQFANWLIGLLLSIIGCLSGFVLWYVANILKKTEQLDEQIKRNNQKITSLREYFNEHLSKIFTTQQNFGEEIIKIRRTMVSTTVVLERRRAEADKIMDDTKRANDRVEEIGRELKQHSKQIQLQGSDIIKLKNGLYMVKGKKND